MSTRNELLEQILVATLAQTSSSSTGWAFYKDGQYTVGAPFQAAVSTTLTLPNNAATIIDSQLPAGVTSFYDGAKITPENSGDYYTFTVRFKAKSTSNAGSFDFGIDIGGTFGQIFKETLVFAKGANTEQAFTVVAPGYTLGTFIANGGVIKVRSGAGTVSFYDIELQVNRTHKAV